jgi:hypothetical protein
MDDTPAHIKKMVFERLMQKPAEERLRMGAEMFDAARTMMRASFPNGLSELQIREELARRTYPDEPQLLEAFITHLRKNFNA